MNNQLILLETIRDFSAGISQQQDHINLDNLVNPLIMDVGQPENQPITLSHFASEKIVNAIARSVEKLMNEHNFPLPANWTSSQLAKDIIGEPAEDLVHLCDVLKDLTVYGFGSDYFHQVLNILHAVTDPVSAGIVL